MGVFVGLGPCNSANKCQFYEESINFRTLINSQKVSEYSAE